MTDQTTEERGHGRIVLWREGDVDENGNVRPRYTSDPIPSPASSSTEEANRG